MSNLTNNMSSHLLETEKGSGELIAEAIPAEVDADTVSPESDLQGELPGINPEASVHAYLVPEAIRSDAQRASIGLTGEIVSSLRNTKAILGDGATCMKRRRYVRKQTTPIMIRHKPYNHDSESVSAVWASPGKCDECISLTLYSKPWFADGETLTMDMILPWICDDFIPVEVTVMNITRVTAGDSILYTAEIALPEASNVVQSAISQLHRPSRLPKSRHLLS
jgi:hypothetical protein